MHFTHAQAPHLVWSGDQVNGNLILQASNTNISTGATSIQPTLSTSSTTNVRMERLAAHNKTLSRWIPRSTRVAKASSRTFALSITESQCPVTPPVVPPVPSSMLSRYLPLPSLRHQSTQHWDQDSEGSSCPSSNSNYCWSKFGADNTPLSQENPNIIHRPLLTRTSTLLVPNKSDGDTVQ